MYPQSSACLISKRTEIGLRRKSESAVNTFLFYRGKEALCEGIIIRTTWAAHAAADAVLLQHIPIAPTTKMTATVAMKDKSGNISISSQRI